MKIIALKSFAGQLSMGKGEVREYNDEVVLQDLLKAEYIKEVKPKAKKGVNDNDSKPNFAK